MIKKLKVRFVVIMMSIATIIMAVTFIALNIRNYRKNEINLETELDMTTEMIKNDMNGFAPGPNTPPADRFVMSFGVVIDKNDYVVYKYYCENISNTHLNELINLVLEGKDKTGSLKDYNLSYMISKDGSNRIIAYVSNKFVDEGFFSTLWMSIYAFIISTIVFFGISLWLASIVTKPVQETFDTQKQFIADASHDLKTPLTVIMANNDIIKEHSKDSIESQMEWINSTQYEAERMRSLVEKMLEIAKADAASCNLVFNEVNISELIEATSLQFEPVAFERKVGIKTDIKEDVVINTDKDTFTRIIYTLIDNAIKYAKENTDVTVTLEHSNRHLRFKVNNLGNVISAKDAPNIFKRFYRAEESRTSEGFGLGLAISKNLCDNLGYRLDFVSNEAEGTTFEIIIK